MHHTPPETRVFAVLGRITCQGLYLRAHVQCGIRAADLLDVDNGRDLLDQAAVPLLGILQLSLRLLALGYVPGVDHHTSHSRVVKQVVYDVLDIAPRAILVRHSELQGRVKPRPFEDLGEYAQCSIPVVRMDGAKCVDPYL